MLEEVFVDLDLAAYLALRWFAWGRPSSSLDAIEGISLEYFNVPDLTDDHDKIDSVRNAQEALEKHALLPPVPEGHVRVLHSFLKPTKSNEELWTIVDGILMNGLWPQPKTSGRYSEDPHSVFFVVEDKASRDLSRYSSNAPWFVADLPFSVYDRRAFTQTRDGKYLFAGVDLTQLRPGSIGFVSGIPAEFIVAVNGMPVVEFERAVGRWGRW